MIAAHAGADAADRSEFVDDLARKDRPCLSQSSISRGIDDEVGRQFRSVAQNHAPFANGVDRNAASHGDAAIDDECTISPAGCAAGNAPKRAGVPRRPYYNWPGNRATLEPKPERCAISTMPTSGLCRPLAQNGLWRRRSLRWSRHNHSASKNARSLSFGRKRPGVATVGAVAASARSLIPISACR